MAKRRADFDDVDINPLAKRQRIVDSAPDLENMSVKELFKTAQMDLDLEEAANNVYGERYRTMIVYFELSQPDDIGQPRTNKVSVLGIANCIRYMQLFQKHILFLHVDYRGLDDVIRFNEILADHCADTLIEFAFWGISEEVIAKYSTFNDNIFDVERPFTRVQRLRIFYANLRDCFPGISTCFPNVSDLELGHVTGTNFTPNVYGLRRLTLGIQNAAMLDVYAPLLNMSQYLGQLIVTVDCIVSLNRVLDLVKNNQGLDK